MSTHDRSFLVAIGAFLAFLGVGLGAFGAHALAERFDARQLEIWKTAVFYHLIHSTALVALYSATHPSATKVTGICFALGVLIFSGSLYALAYTGIRWLGAVTPIGGVLFLVGWAWLAISALRS